MRVIDLLDRHINPPEGGSIGWILRYIKQRTKEGTPSIENCPDEWTLFVQQAAWLTVWDRVMDIVAERRKRGAAVKLVGGFGSSMLTLFTGSGQTMVLFDPAKHEVRVGDQVFPVPLDLAELDGWSEEVGRAIFDALSG